MAMLALVFMTPTMFLYVLFHPELVDERFHVYKMLYRDIEIGMTREQVFALVDKYYAEDGPRKRPTILEDTPDNLDFFMNPENSTEPNCEGIFLTMSDGRVADKEYSPD